MPEPAGITAIRAALDGSKRCFAAARPGSGSSSRSCWWATYPAALALTTVRPWDTVSSRSLAT